MKLKQARGLSPDFEAIVTTTEISSGQGKCWDPTISGKYKACDILLDIGKARLLDYSMWREEKLDVIWDV